MNKIFESLNTKIFINDSNHFNYQKIQNELKKKYSEMLNLIPDHFKSQKVCERAIKKDLSTFACVSACYETHDMFSKSCLKRS